MTNSADNTINREKKTNRIREVVDGQTDRQMDRQMDRQTYDRLDSQYYSKESS